MKLKYVAILIVLLILTCGISFASSEFTVGNHTFDVPKGYDVKEINDDSSTLTLKNNTNYTIFINAGDVVDFDTAKHSRQVAGFNLMGEDNFTTENNISVFQQNFMKNESYFSFYSFEIDGIPFEIGYSFPVDDDSLDSEDNPVNVIVESV